MNSRNGNRSDTIEYEAGVSQETSEVRKPIPLGQYSGSTSLLRRIVLACIAVFVILVFVFQSGSGRPFEVIQSAVQDALDSSKLNDAGSTGLKRYYGLEAADYDGVLFYTSTHPMSAEELLVIRAASDEQVGELEDAIQKRIEDKLTEFGTYAPEQTALIKNAVVLTRGKHVFFAVSQDAEKYRKAFTKAL